MDADAPFSFEEDDNTVLAPLRTTGFRRSLSSSPKQADAISEWTKLAQLVLVQVHGSCEDERMFSAMSYRYGHKGAIQHHTYTLSLPRLHPKQRGISG